MKNLKIITIIFSLPIIYLLFNPLSVFAQGTFTCSQAFPWSSCGRGIELCDTAQGYQPIFPDGKKCEDYAGSCPPAGDHICINPAITPIITQPAIPPAPPTTATSASCEWTALNNASSPYNGQPAFCVGGFSTESDLRSAKVRFNCEGAWCGAWGTRAWNWITGNDNQEYSLSSATDVGTDSSGKYFTCLSGDFSSQIKDAINQQMNSLNIARCLTVGSSKSGGGILRIDLQTIDRSQECLNAASELQSLVHPTISGNITSSSGTSLCKDTFSIELTADGKSIKPVPGTLTALGETPICTFAANINKQSECETCLNQTGVWTPFGCIEATPQEFVAKLLQIAIGIAGGLAFLMIIYGGFTIMTSSGNPEKLNGGKEIVTSAIAGLLLIIFSVVILKIIGVDILKIPGL